MSAMLRNLFSEVTIMCNGNNIWWIIILVVLFCGCGCGNNNGCGASLCGNGCERTCC